MTLTCGQFKQLCRLLMRLLNTVDTISVLEAKSGGEKKTEEAKESKMEAIGEGDDDEETSGDEDDDGGL